MVWEKILESPLDCREIQLAHPIGISPGCSLEGLILKLKLQYFGYLMQRTDSLEKTLMLGKIEGGRRRVQKRIKELDGLTESMDMSLSKLRELVMGRDKLSLQELNKGTLVYSQAEGQTLMLGKIEGRRRRE